MALTAFFRSAIFLSFGDIRKSCHIQKGGIGFCGKRLKKPKYRRFTAWALALKSKSSKTGIAQMAHRFLINKTRRKTRATEAARKKRKIRVTVYAISKTGKEKL
jgi:hypothetical protein